MFFTTLLLASLATAQFPSNTITPVPLPSYTGCPPSGPLLPRPSDLASSQYIQEAAANLTDSLNAAVEGRITAGWVVDNVTFSVAVVSPNAQSNSTNGDVVWEYHHRAKEATQGTPHITGDTQYLVGSVSKVFTDLLVLRMGLDPHRPVTDFLPELQGNSPIAWGDISLQMLGESLAGIPPNYVYEMYFLQPLYEAFGFPSLSREDYPPCGVMGMPNATACTEADMLRDLKTMNPVTIPNTRPTYSTLAFAVTALCLERATNRTYAELLREYITMPLNMSNTGVSPGDSSRAAIPPGMSSWGSDYGLEAAGGGLFSSIYDLTTFLSTTLSHTILPFPKTERWLNPTSHTSSPSTLIGQPWEILRTTHLVNHTVDLYGKSGGAMGYTSQIAVVDQYGVGFIVLSAGPAGSTELLYRAIVGTFLPAIEAETRNQARSYTGSWRSADSPPTNTNTSSPQEQEQVTMELDLDHGTGIRLTSLTRGNSCILDGIRAVWETAYESMGFGILSDELRLYPTGIERAVSPSDAEKLRPNLDPEEDLIRQEWRVNFDIIPVDGTAMSDLPGQQGWSESPFCASWQIVDWMHYGGNAVDLVVFLVGAGTGKVVGVEVPVLRGDVLVPVDTVE